ncbi:lipoprotein, putative [gamma proteobacterium NOR5-3]|nr:lipoprotein, putative [gamma proteobacterium NOR5-3]
MQAGQGLQRPWRRHLLWPLLLLLSACSSTTFVYNRLDFILPWYLDRYVDLDRTQSEQLDVELGELLQWHRSEELPGYLNFLNDLAEDLHGDLASPLTVARLQSYADRAEQAWFRVRDPGLELLLRLGDDLSQEQIDDFIAVMDKKQSKYERKYLDRDDEEVVEDAFESLEETLEDYLGRLDESQLQRLRVAAGALLRSDAIWLRERSAWTAELAEALQRKAGWQQRVRGIVRDWEARLDPEVQAIYDHNTTVVQAAIVDVVNSRSDKQDSRLRKKIDGFRDDLVLLISQQKN